jgi:hypothetical protein
MEKWVAGAYVSQALAQADLFTMNQGWSCAAKE